MTSGLASIVPSMAILGGAAVIAGFLAVSRGWAAESRMLAPDLAIAGAANGVAHPLMSVAVGGYFPGLATSPLIGVLGVVLLRRLLAVTQAV